jgi:hypothetical protein
MQHAKVLVRFRKSRFEPNGFLEDGPRFLQIAEIQADGAKESEHIDIVWSLLEIRAAFRFSLLDLAGVDQAKYVIDCAA